MISSVPRNPAIFHADSDPRAKQRPTAGAAEEGPGVHPLRGQWHG